MITIKIEEETHTKQGMADALRYIADQLEKGIGSSWDPTWEISGEEEPEEED